MAEYELGVSMNEVTVPHVTDNVIYYGAPGTGKTYRLAEIFSKYGKNGRFMVTFHQSYTYEEFVEGLKPVLNSDDVKYEIAEGIFLKACVRAAELAGYSAVKGSVPAEDRTALDVCCEDFPESRRARFGAEGLRTVLFCIDEINRANVSYVFGDLISLIEKSKRLGSGEEMMVYLPYSKKLFGVPANLQIIGTMNTADRSIQVLDSALRRRFEFEEFPPKPELLYNETAAVILKSINSRIRVLAGKDRQIGHAYFMGIPAGDGHEHEIFNVMTRRIIPLLQEYFYDDIDNIRKVLNESGAVEGRPFYVEDKEAAAVAGPMGMETDLLYRLDEEGFAQVKDNDSASEYLKHL